MWIQDLAEYIRAQNIAGIGNNVFIFTMKAEDIGAMVTSHNQGVPNIPDLPDYYKGPMQIIVRSPNPQSSLEQIQAIVTLLDSNRKRKQGVDMSLALPNTKFNYIFPRHFPVVYPRSDGGYYEASVNFDVCFVALDAI